MQTLIMMSENSNYKVHFKLQIHINILFFSYMIKII
jgi:hypothetical protein